MLNLLPQVGVLFVLNSPPKLGMHFPFPKRAICPIAIENKLETAYSNDDDDDDDDDDGDDDDDNNTVICASSCCTLSNYLHFSRS
jgi:hypothetical protein